MKIAHASSSRSWDFIPRYTGPREEEMTTRQKSIRDTIKKSRPRTGLSGPFGPWLAVPNIAEPAQALGKACRYDTSLSFRESELVILLTSAAQQSATEFDIHESEAQKAGLSPEVIAAIPRNTNDGGDKFLLETITKNLLPLLRNDREKAIAAFATELLERSTVSDDTYNRTKEVLNGKDSVLVEITSIIGYYTYVAYTLNVFRIPSSFWASRNHSYKWG